MTTYSIYDNTLIQSIVYNIDGDMTPLLSLLCDNTSYKINPIDIRSNIISIYKNSAFINSHIDNEMYISNNTASTSKYLIGKRSYNGVDIMDNDLYNNDSDIFIYNTKKDVINNDNTKITILNTASTSSPFIEVLHTKTTTDVDTYTLLISNIGTNKDSISLKSTNGVVNINNIPLMIDKNSIKDNSIITSIDGSIGFKDVVIDTQELRDVAIYGISVKCNGYQLLYTDSKPSTLEMNSIHIGDTFKNVPLCSMLRRLLYDNIKPICSLEILPPYNNGYIEVNTCPNVEMRYMLRKECYNLKSLRMTQMVDSILDLSSNDNNIIYGTSQAIIIQDTTINTYNILLSDVNGNTASAEKTLTYCYPIYYGLSNNNIIDSNTFRNTTTLNKLLDKQENWQFQVNGNGYLYIMYDYTYGGKIKNIIDMDNNAYIISSCIDTQGTTISSPQGTFTNKKYFIYKSNNKIDAKNKNIKIFFN